MTLATWHFHIEISSKCTLRCPRCARQEVQNSLVNTELGMDFFQRNFSADFIISNVEKITFCGNDGDPIYAHDLIDCIAYFKSIKPIEIIVITNGSHKKPSWWKKLGSVLSYNDTVHFSIDGWDNTSNNKYRVNSDFDSIIQGITALRSSSQCRLIWAAIAFSFNEHHLDSMQDHAKRLGMDAFQLTKSTKFGRNYPSYGAKDQLQPSDSMLSRSHRFERQLTVLSQRTLNRPVPLKNLELFRQIKKSNNVLPLCEIGNKGLYIDAQGRLFPCCWVANRYQHNSEWQQIANTFDLNKITLTDAIGHSFWNEEFRNFSWQECQTKCNYSIVDEKYATQW